MKSKILPLVAMGIIGGLEITALLMGVDGQLFSVVVAIIAGLGGYAAGKAIK